MLPKWDSKGRVSDREHLGDFASAAAETAETATQGTEEGRKEGEDFTFGMNETFARLSELWQS